jgi:hypothetical protein
MVTYPSAKELEQIAARRRQLMRELISCLLTDNEEEQRKGLDRLVRRYGQSEVECVATFMQQGVEGRDLDNDEAILYRRYVEYYRRFGGQRPFLTLEEYNQANDEYAPLFTRQEAEQTLSEDEQARLAYLEDLLLKNVLLLEDVTPEDPPPTMPDVELPPIKPAKSPRKAEGGKGGYPICERDGFPMVTINGRLECSAEFINRCVGEQPVVDMIRRGKTPYYVFENGHELPLLCSCCGGPLSVDDLEEERNATRGWRLRGMSIGTQTLRDGSQVQELNLEFSKGGILSRIVQVPVAFEVAARMRHPADCPYGKRAPSPEKKRSRARRKRRRKR